MPLNVCISYGTADDQVTALRLQALAAVYGLTAYVPPAHTRKTRSVDAEMRSKIQGCDVFVGINVLQGFPEQDKEAFWKEREIALSSGNPMVLIGTPEGLVINNNKDVFLDPEQPDKSESRLTDFLERTPLSPDTTRAVGALGTVALGLLMFAPQE